MTLLGGTQADAMVLGGDLESTPDQAVHEALNDRARPAEEQVSQELEEAERKPHRLKENMLLSRLQRKFLEKLHRLNVDIEHLNAEQRVHPFTAFLPSNLEC